MSEIVESAGKALDVLDLLFRADFFHGLSPSQIAAELAISKPAVSRYIATLEQRGAIERITETGRIRPSVRWARYAGGVMRSLDAVSRRSAEMTARVLTDD